MKMMKRIIISNSLAALAAAGFLASLSSVKAATIIGFEDISGADDQEWYQFYSSSLNVGDTYFNYKWGFGITPGSANAIFDVSNSDGGWAISHINNQASGGWHAPNGVTGDYYAANAHGRISLWIDFQEEVTFTSGFFSWLTPSNPPVANSSTIQLFGYADSASGIGDELNHSAVVTLTDTLTELTANFAGIRYLEIRSNAGNSWFAVDNLVVGTFEDASPVPEPGSTLALGLLLGSALGLRHRRGYRRHHAVC